MNYEKSISIPRGYERLITRVESGETLTDLKLPALSNVGLWTAKFPNGNEMDTKLNTSEDGLWTEAVLFNSNGNELCHSDVGYSLEGVWELEYNGDTYKVDVNLV